MLEMQLRVLTLKARVTASVAYRPDLFSSLDVNQHTSALSTHSVGCLSGTHSTLVLLLDCLWSRRTHFVAALPSPRPSAHFLYLSFRLC
jgi:hypothetical protein